MNDLNQIKLVDTAAFLDLLHGPGALIYFQVAGKTWKNKPQTFRQAGKSLCWRNTEGDDICFVVNSGGTTKNSITNINAFWIDWDCGRNDNGDYHPIDFVIQRKNEFKKNLLDPFQPAPSIVVETRNGFHVYWLADNGVTVQEFEEVQARLCEHFGSDPQVNRACALMRLPGFDWVKASSGLPRFNVRVISSTSIRFGAQVLLDVLPKSSTKGSSEAVQMRDLAKCVHNKCSGISNHCTYCGHQTPLSSNSPNSSVVLNSMLEAIEFMKKQDLATFLNITVDRSRLPQRVLCPFHPDKNPSATITCNPGDLHWLFHCHSQRCGVKGTIIDLAKIKLNTKNKDDVYRHLMAHYRITIDTGWKDRQIKLLDWNIAILQDIKAIKTLHPWLYRWIGRITNDLIGKIALAKTHVVSERNQLNGSLVFFASLREFNRASLGLSGTPRHFGRQPERVDRYCALGLMMKLHDNDLPGHLRDEAKRRCRQKGHTYRIQFYTIPQYTDAVLQEADRRARLLTEAGASVRGISRPLIAEILGDKIAGEVYPQCRKGKLTQDQFSQDVEAALKGLIALHGYGTTGKLRLALASRSEYASVTHRRIEKCLPGILKRCGLVKMTCTKAMKSQLRISTGGYPKVIVPSKMYAPAGRAVSLAAE